MAEILSNSTNIAAHYSSATKTSRPNNIVVSGPKAIPGRHVYNDNDATNRIRQANNEIEAQSKEFRKSSVKRFCKVFGCIVAGILGVIGISKLGKFFK